LNRKRIKHSASFWYKIKPTFHFEKLVLFYTLPAARKLIFSGPNNKGKNGIFTKLFYHLAIRQSREFNHSIGFHCS